MEKDVLLVSLRNGALYLDQDNAESISSDDPQKINSHTHDNLRQLLSQGFVLDRDATLMFDRLAFEDQAEVIDVIEEVYESLQNWNPLVKGWLTPTYENIGDHLTTIYYNALIMSGEIDNHGEADRLPCGHYIPKGTFDIDRYTGCPFCGTPIMTGDNVYLGQTSRLRVLKVWTEDDAYDYFEDLLRSTVPLSPTETDSLLRLLSVFELPDVNIPMRETSVVVALSLLDSDNLDEARRLLKTPADVLRMLWYEKTGHLLVIKPMTMLKAACKYNYNVFNNIEGPQPSIAGIRQDLKLKYTRHRCRQIATILNEMDITADKACETMNPRRGMWVRLIRALRLAEFAKKPGYQRLAQIIDKFYRNDYYVAQGQIDLAVDVYNYPRTIQLLSKRPGLFARCIFSLTLKFNPYKVIADFTKIVDNIPLRLIISLGDNAETYYKNIGSREVRISTGLRVNVPTNPNLKRLREEERLDIIDAIKHITIDALKSAYAKTPMPGKKIYIDPELLRMALPIGERPQTIQNAMYVPQGTRFDVEGDKVRIFLHWGQGMKAAPIDLDISAAIVYDDARKDQACAFFNLSPRGASHSGDMRAIPDDVGTAEYIELDIPTLKSDGARYVVFCANQYSQGKLLPNAMAGWMDSKFPMSVSAESGVAYDPSCVQHFVKVNDAMLSKGLVFGVLDVLSRKITYMEMPFDGQTVGTLNMLSVLTMLNKLSKKLSIGKALEMMAEARNMTVVNDAADVDDDTTIYDLKWAHNMAAVVKLLVPDRTETVKDED